jgi:hypothetical protein
VLLFVLALLALFSLVTVTFVVVARIHKRGTFHAAQVERFGDSPEQLLREAALQVVRGTTNPRSVIGPHSLLEDLYGSDGLTGTVVSAAWFVNNATGMVDITIQSPISGYFNGRVFTMTSGPLAGQSGRIVDTPANAHIVVHGLGVTSTLPSPGDTFVINGAPFNGTGFGFDAEKAPNFDPVTQVLLGRADPQLGSGFPYALLPNAAFFTPTPANPPDIGYQDPAGPGGADEDYDAVDYQNMLLAMRVVTSNDPNYPSAVVFPSLHRPELINYWITQAGVADWKVLATSKPVLARKISLRPVGGYPGSDHPEFTGSNPNPFDPINGPWDVDNDGDGKPDSIWVDLGFPAQTAADGRTYKPLFAILCEDLDGKLNLNAHGNLNQLVEQATVTGGLAGATVAGPYAGTATATANLAVGQGYGPAEVNPLLMLGPADYTNLLVGNGPTQGRYGELNYANTLSVPTVPPSSALPSPGMTNEPSDSLLNPLLPAPRPDQNAWLKQFEFPDDHFNEQGLRRLSAFGTPPDLDGDGFIGLDPSGNPIYPTAAGPAGALFGMGEYLDRWNNPYQIDLFRRPLVGSYAPNGAGTPLVVPIDVPFQPSELERILRYNDVDAPSLPGRLTTLATNTLGTNAHYRYRVTTDSWDLPVPSVVPTQDAVGTVTLGTPPTSTGLYNPELYQNSNPPYPPYGRLHLADLVRLRREREKRRLSQIDATNMGASNTVDPSVAMSHFGMELNQGLRFDLNRPFGNGRDDNANGVVDEPEEATNSVNPETIWDNTFANPPGNSSPVPVFFDHANGFARQYFAKNLYLLMMLLIDETFGDAAYPPASGQTGYDNRLKLATHVAQWAVNVVDFRDRDSIMTPFEFDIFPFTDENPAYGTQPGDPWDVDFNLLTNETATNSNVKRGVVWGCERPELLITETLAFHDRRVADSPMDSSGIADHTTTNPDPAKRDNHFDQLAGGPQGSLFIELYNPWGVDDCQHGELYDLSRVPPQLQLDRGPASTPASPSPVWRLLITKTAEAPDKVDFGSSFSASNATHVVYFATGQQPDPAIANPKLVTFTAAVSGGILPGGYAVIGPDGSTDAGLSSANRRLVMNLLDPMKPAFAMTDGTGANVLKPYQNQPPLPGTGSSSIKPVTAGSVPDYMGAKGPVRFSISEPYDGYAPVSGTTDDPSDLPTKRLDLDAADQQRLWSNSTTPASQPFRYVHLQRLANPLIAWDAATNPYVTIDTMPLDLTVYNSKDSMSSEESNGNITPPLWYKESATLRFNSRQRDGKNADPVGTSPYDIWAQSSSQSPLTAGDSPLTSDDEPPVAQTTAPNHTLGYLNYAFTPPTTGRLRADNPFNMPINNVAHDYTGQPNLQVGTTTTPFASFHWPNRPFVSAFELLHVPAYSPSRLLEAHWPLDITTTYYTSTAPSTYYTTANIFSVAGLANDRLNFRDIAFRHLLPWFVAQTTLTNPYNPAQTVAPHLYRLFDFVHVPSRFAGTDEYLNPVAFQTGRHQFHPPFNKVSRYREPGKININTIFDDGLTWRALTNGFPNLGAQAYWAWVDLSRKDTILDWRSQPATPTAFPNPFRSAAGNFLVPLDSLRRVKLNVNGSIRKGIDSTLLRPHPNKPSIPLFANSTATQLATEPNQNSYFHYQLLTKLGNILTTRSNVYAVWITVGYFEAQRAPVDLGHPDGWQLGRELGADTGEIKRHRAFFLIDRTLPVGFQRGEDLNVQNCFLIQRFIE